MGKEVVRKRLRKSIEARYEELIRWDPDNYNLIAKRDVALEDLKRWDVERGVPTSVWEALPNKMRTEINEAQNHYIGALFCLMVICIGSFLILDRLTSPFVFVWSCFPIAMLTVLIYARIQFISDVMCRIYRANGFRDDGLAYSQRVRTYEDALRNGCEHGGLSEAVQDGGGGALTLSEAGALAVCEGEAIVEEMS